MARKVFMSVLGVSFYGECIYVKDNFKSSNTRFIQQATLEKLTQNDEWTANDKGYILLTEKARTSNWVVKKNIRYNPKEKKEEDYHGLKEILDTMNLPFDVEDVNIEDGNTETEIWNIFDVVFEKLQEGDELYFDITHGFRYLPMLVVVLGNYAKFLKKIKVKSITYGNFEASYEENESLMAPIVDVTSFSTLQDWTSAASDYLNHGDVSKLKEVCLDNTLSPILCKTRGKDMLATNQKFLINALLAFTKELTFCRGKAIIDSVSAERIKEYSQDLNNDYIKPFIPFFEKIYNSVKKFQKGRASNMFLAADTCMNYGEWQQAATLLREGVITYICERNDLDYFDDDLRENVVNMAFTQAYKKKEACKSEKKDNSGNKQNYEEYLKFVLSDKYLRDKEFITEFWRLREARNDYEHAGMKKQIFQPNTLQEKIKHASDFFKQKLEIEDSNILEKSSQIFINLSNHPSSTWSTEQLEASKEFGDIVDMDFPAVAPDATPEDINAIADGLVCQIMKKASDNIVTVHVMGEMALTYRLVQRLTSLGIRCVCSTTNRIVKDEGNGKRVTEFHFNQFRDYGD